MNRLRRATPGLGIGALVVTFGTMGLAVALSPSFRVTGNALSNLGHAGHPAGTALTELLFNGGLIVGGLAGAAFALGLALADGHPVRRFGAIVFGIAMLSMGGVGLFPQDGLFHFEVAAGFYLLFSAGAMIYGVGQALDGAVRGGLASFGLGAGNLLVWVAWGAAGGLAVTGLAVPELAGAALVAVWTVLQVRRLHRRK